MLNINDLSDEEKNQLLQQLLGSSQPETTETNKKRKRKRKSKKYDNAEQKGPVEIEQDETEITDVRQNVGKQRYSIVDRVRNKKTEFLDLKSEGQEDIKTDKILWGNNKPTQRKPKVNTVIATCNGCNKTFKGVYPHQISAVQGTNDKIYRCPKCSKNRPV